MSIGDGQHDRVMQTSVSRRRAHPGRKPERSPASDCATCISSLLTETLYSYICQKARYLNV